MYVYTYLYTNVLFLLEMLNIFNYFINVVRVGNLIYSSYVANDLKKKIDVLKNWLLY